MKKAFVLLSLLIFGITSKGNATAILNILNVESKSLAEIVTQNIDTGQQKVYSDPYSVTFGIPNGLLAMADAGPLYYKGTFVDTYNIFGQGNYDPDGKIFVPEIIASSELNMRFRVEGSGATIGAFGVLFECPGYVEFSLLDETKGTGIDFWGGGSPMDTGYLPLIDGHIYKLSAMLLIDSQGDGGSGYFDWIYNSGFVSRVPEPTTILLVGIGLVGLAGVRFRMRR